MRIAIDKGPTSGGHSIRGVGVYVRELLKGLNTQGVDVNKENLGDYDIVHFTSFKPFEISLPFSKPDKTKFVITIYDLIPLIYPKHYPPGFRGGINWQINKYLIKKYADAIITISETSKKDICRFLRVDPRKVFVTYLGPRNIFRPIKEREILEKTKKEFNLPERFALYVGDINYNKNIPNLIKACKLAKIPLVICGRQAKEIKSLDLNHPELVHLKDVSFDYVIALGYVDDEDLVKVYNLATLYVQPSFYEGFGLPLLEAISCKTPIAVSKNQCHVEILGSEISYFDPNNINEMSKSILNPKNINSTPREYSWKNTINETKAVYEKV